MKICVVGAGFAGATVARELAEEGYKIDIFDSRRHVAGNAYDYIDKYGIRIHKYGPHLFHTNNERVWNYVSRFTEWVDYKHKVEALLKSGDYVILPVNNKSAAAVGRENVIETFFRPYSEKMWGMPLEDIDKSITDRVKIRDDDNEFYFPDDKYQALPIDGYDRLVSTMLHHENIDVYLGVEITDSRVRGNYDHVFSSAPIDSWFNFVIGRLPYRSIKFENIVLPQPGHVLPVTTVNFTTKTGPTRVTEWSRLPNSFRNPNHTVLTYEYPCDYSENNYERYYPVKDAKGTYKALYRRYKKYAEEHAPYVTFIGRCGTYQYLDMHQAINQALQVARKFIDDKQSNRTAKEELA